MSNAQPKSSKNLFNYKVVKTLHAFLHFYILLSNDEIKNEKTTIEVDRIYKKY